MFGKDSSFAHIASLLQGPKPQANPVPCKCIPQKAIFVDIEKHSYVLLFSQRVPLRSS